MEQIKKITEKIENEAENNVKNFNFTKFCFKNIFDILNNSGVFEKTFSELTTCYIENKNQISLSTFRYGVVKEDDGCYYPMVDWFIILKDLSWDFESEFCLTLTPFTAKLDNETKDAGVYGGCDKQLTLVWQKVMKTIFKDEYKKALAKYYEDIHSLKECEIKDRAIKDMLENDRKYHEAINSI